MSEVRATPSPPRACAISALDDVLARKRALDAALAERLAPLDRRDRALARAVTAMALRRLGQVDDALAQFMDRPPKGRAAVARQILRAGGAELLFMAAPPHAVVDLAVAEAHRRGCGRQAGLVNAVLRRLAEFGAEIVKAQDAPRLNAPNWLWTRWVAAYGEPTARAIATAHMREPATDVTVRGEPRRWVGRLGGALLPTGSVRVRRGGDVTTWPGFAAGAWWVQDAAAALPARLLGAAERLHVLDLCAAPGGKTAQLAAAGARVTAVDRAHGRLQRLRGNLARLKLTAKIIEAEVADLPAILRGAGRYDCVLLDAPCSATGTLRRHPDIAWTRAPEDVMRAAAAQARLLAAACAHVRPGGRLVYAVCSLEPEEGPALIADMLEQAPDFSIEPIAATELPGLADALTRDGAARLLPSQWPDHGHLDGFYIARLRRRR